MLIDVGGQLGQPRLQRLQADGIHSIDTMAAFPSAAHQADLAQHVQMLGNLRLPEVKAVDDLADPRLADRQRLQYLPTAAVAECVEDVRCGRRSSHARNYIPISECIARRATHGSNPARGSRKLTSNRPMATRGPADTLSPRAPAYSREGFLPPFNRSRPSSS